jgi:Tfp pilus assembly protein PilN
MEQSAEANPVEAGPIRVAWASVPKVNLLPVEIMEARRFRRTQALLGVGVIAAVLLGGAGTVWAQQGINDANDQLTAAQSRVTGLQAQQVKYATAPLVIAQVEAANAARTLAMGQDVLWYRYLSEVSDALPTGVGLTQLGMITTGTESAPGAAPDALTPGGIGTLQMSGTAGQYKQVASWLEALNKITGFSAASLTSATYADGVVIFTATAVVDPDALSRRYQKEAN